MTRNFERAPQDLFFKSPRVNDTRWGEMVSHINDAAIATRDAGVVIAGYPDDEGIRLNHGRIGAKDAPDSIRRALYRLTPTTQTRIPVYDIGNLIISGDLEDRQTRAKVTCLEAMQKGHYWLSLGGGNDYAYVDASSFLTRYGKKGIVVNIDAHFDLRPSTNGPTSGTPFFQCFEEHGHYNLVEIGIQNFSNTPYYFDYAQKKKVKTFTFAESHGKLSKILQSIGPKKSPVFLCVDIDAFSGAYGAGASATNPIGLDANEFYLALEPFFKSYNVRGVGIYEANPSLDPQGQTTKLAAIIAHSFLSHVERANTRVSKKQHRK